jgi:glycerol-3-phosphate O-acyltransferase
MVQPMRQFPWTEPADLAPERGGAVASRRIPHVLSVEEIGDDVVRRVVSRVLGRAETAAGPALEDVADDTLYAELSRLAHGGTGHPAGADGAFAMWLRSELVHADQARLRELLHAIVDHYVREIGGHFDPRVYRLATSVVPPAISLLLRGVSLRGPHPFDVDDRLLIEGETTALKALVRLGTVILAPTHVSNFDALVMGSVIHRLGLPPFAYGAGINLFTNPLIGFFMRHLGAYTIDRKKTDPLYRATLKEYATVLLERGQHNLFFPGGTRSRSGAVEQTLKKGLLGTAPAAFRRALESGAPRPRVFVVPCTLTYPLVLEASSLIADHLETEGGSHDLDVGDEFNLPRRWLDFLGGLRKLDLRVHVRISRPLDWLGNDVDDEGTSRDARGRRVDPARYLLIDGRLTEDAARDAELTRILAARLAASFRRDNVALPTSVVALVLFERLRRECNQENLFRFVRNLDPARSIRVDDVLADLARVQIRLADLERRGAVRVAPGLLDAGNGVVLDRSLTTFATYHPVPVVERHGDRLRVADPGLLFYYRNRLAGYGLVAGAGEGSS